MSTKQIGVFLWKKPAKRYGLIKHMKGDAFFHADNWRDEKALDWDNQIPIIFEIRLRENRENAVNARYLHNSADHWISVFEQCLVSDTIILEEGRRKELFHLLSYFISSLQTAEHSDVAREGLRRYCSSRKHLSADNGLFLIRKFNQLARLHTVCYDLAQIVYDHLSDDHQFEIWTSHYPVFQALKLEIPNATLTKHHKELSIADLSKISGLKNAVELYHLIGLQKVNHLKAEYTLKLFNTTNAYIDKVSHIQLRQTLIAGATEIAEVHYTPYALDILDRALEAEVLVTAELLGSLINLPATVYGDSYLPSLKAEIQRRLFDRLGVMQIVVLKSFFDSIQFSAWLLYHYTHLPLQTVISLLDETGNGRTVIRKLLIEHARSESDVVKLKSKAHMLIGKEATNKIIQEHMPAALQFSMWQKGHLADFDLRYLHEYLDDKPSKYRDLQVWVSNGKISEEGLPDILIENIDNTKADSKPAFDRIFYSVQMLIYLCIADIEKEVAPINKPLVTLLLWHFQAIRDFSLQTLAAKFIYFSAEDQVDIIKRLFYLHFKEEIRISIDYLVSLTKADVDLFRLNHQLNSFTLDLSTLFVIGCLQSIQQKGRFLTQAELLQIVLQNNITREHNLQVSHYFEKCQGRASVSSKRSIEEIEYNGAKYFAFRYDFLRDRDFLYLLKTFPVREYKSDIKKWLVPVSEKENLLRFCKNHEVFFYDDKALDSSETDIQRRSQPDGMEFCAGRKSPALDNTYHLPFWWCCNKPCFNNCETHHSQKTDGLKPWSSYTLLDFCRLLHIDTDEQSKGGLVPSGKYYQFVTLINRFNDLLGKLFCLDCNQILHPKRTSHFARHNVTEFACVNSTCRQAGVSVYLSNCWAPHLHIIDSRVSKKCEHGWYICNDCGSCCCHQKLVERRDNLLQNNQFVPASLHSLINNRQAHLENERLFCYRCLQIMTMDRDVKDNFYCTGCHTQYNRKGMAFKKAFTVPSFSQPPDHSSYVPGIDDYYEPVDPFG